MKAVATVGKVSGTYILASGQQVLHTFRDKSSQRYLERIGIELYVVSTSGARMQVHMIAPHAYRVLVHLRAPVRSNVRVQILFDNRVLGVYAARLSYIRVLG